MDSVSAKANAASSRAEFPRAGERDKAESRSRRIWHSTRDYLLPALLVLLITATWCQHYNRWTKDWWGAPINYIGGRELDMVYTGDALWGMTLAKLSARGELGFFNKEPASLGAPFGANWNDWPTFEEAVNGWWTLLVVAFGLFRGSNLVTLCGHLLAGLTFYWLCRYLRYDRVFAFLGAALFALSRYAFWRNLPNLSLTYYWHIPLGLLVAWWCIRDKPITSDKRKLLFCALIAVVHAAQNPYYSGIFLQLLFWAALYSFLRWKDWRRVLLPIGIGTVLVATLAVVNVDTFFHWLRNGPNPDAALRSYGDVERYALKPLELFLPFSHSLTGLSKWATEVYFKQTMIPTEQGSAYIGVIACLALVFLIWLTATAVARGDLRRIPVHFWGVALVTLFAVNGTINGALGLFGFRLFRASNRYSIVIMAILLLFAVKQLSRLTNRWRTAGTTACAGLLLAIGIFDQVPPPMRPLQEAQRDAWRSDRRFVARVESALPAGAMIFQLPVRLFPEMNKVGAIDDYEDFRPFLHSSQLRFSYGDIKGRYRSRWQADAPVYGAAPFVKLLERYGFSAIVVNRKGYGGYGSAVVEDLRPHGVTRIIARSQDWICLALNPSRHPELPPVFGKGWYGLEGGPDFNRRWSFGDAEVILHNSGDTPQSVRVIFGINATNCRKVAIHAGGQQLHSGEFDHVETDEPFEFRVTLRPGDNVVRFVTDSPAELASSNDPRPLAFSINNFRVVSDEQFDEQQPLR